MKRFSRCYKCEAGAKTFLPALLISLICVLIVASFWPAPFYQHVESFLILFGALVVVELSSRLLFSRPACSVMSGRRLCIRGLKLVCIVALILVIKGFWAIGVVIGSPGFANVAEKTELLDRRRYLINRVAKGGFGPSDIPAIVESPFREELAIATLSMTCVSLTNMAFLYPDTRAEALDKVSLLIEDMLRSEIRRYEVIWWGHDALERLEGGKGQIGYLGHLNLMLAAYRLLGGDGKFDTIHRKVTSELVRRLESSPSFHIETFPNAIFTADNTFVYLSIHYFDVAFGEDHSSLIGHWIDYTRNHLVDAEYGMVRYFVSDQGAAIGTSRGVLQAWNSIWLPHIDESFAAEQYAKMKLHLSEMLVGSWFGGVREYPRGKTGPTDIIAGPVVFGLSGSATGFALGGARWWQDEDFYMGLLRTAEFVGTSMSNSSGKRYLIAPLVGDAVLLAARTNTKWDRRFLRVSH